VRRSSWARAPTRDVGDGMPGSRPVLTAFAFPFLAVTCQDGRCAARPATSCSMKRRVDRPLIPPSASRTSDSSALQSASRVAPGRRSPGAGRLHRCADGKAVVPSNVHI
jgi:hypothetical protein